MNGADERQQDNTCTQVRENTARGHTISKTTQKTEKGSYCTAAGTIYAQRVEGGDCWKMIKTSRHSRRYKPTQSRGTVSNVTVIWRGQLCKHEY